MKKSYIFSFLTAAAVLTGCSKENPFGGSLDGEGQFMKSALSMDLQSDDIIRGGTRADVNLDDFTVIFTRQGQQAPAAKYLYKDMPDVVTLPAGTYTCIATYGELRDADWDNPYYLGSSEAFEVNAYEITSYIEPIVCSLQNVKVSVVFDPALIARMSVDSYVEVKVGANSSLAYTPADAAAGKAGYFKHTDECSLVATFRGSIDGKGISETKSYVDVRKGYHYRITFKLHNGSADEGSGDTDVLVSTDASVTVIGVDAEVEVDDDPLLDDSERPVNGGGDKPDTPDDPKAPSIEGLNGITLDGVNVNPTECEIMIRSYADDGITGLTCDIVSNDLTPDELKSAGLDSHLDLVNPGSLEDGLNTLGLPVNVGGQKEVKFVITNFLTMLAAFEGQHSFVLTVTDANGTTQKTLIIEIQ